MRSFGYICFFLSNLESCFLFFCPFFLFHFTPLHSKTIYILPFPSINFETLFFGDYKYNDPNSQARDETSKTWIYLRKALEKNNFAVKAPCEESPGDDVTYLISLSNIDQESLKNFSHIPKSHRFLLVFEPPVVSLELHNPSLAEYFGKIFTLFDDVIDNETYFKMFFPQPRLKMIQPIVDWSEKKFATLIANDNTSDHPDELYTARRKTIDFFERGKIKGFDLYGNSPSWVRYKNWKGAIKNKWPILRNYKFCFSYENTRGRSGYITEKIFDCFVSGCVPVYLGADSVTQYIPKNCFISANDFSNEKELHRFLKTMDRNTYDNYIRSIDDFLKSDQAKLFSIQHFIEIILPHVGGGEVESVPIDS